MKVLILSHNPITTYQNMGKTFLSLFSSFDKLELCQMYIYPTVPDIDACNSYYRVTDRDVLKSYFRFGHVKSRILTQQDINPGQHSFFESEEDAEFFKKKSKTSVTLLCRDLMWLFSMWYNSALKKWLEQEKPTCIFLAPGESKFIYNIALKIAKKLNIDIYTYICDEYYFLERPVQVLDRVQLYLLKRKMKDVLTRSKGIITICDELANSYHEEFGTETYTIFTGSNFPIALKPTEPKDIKGITYMGNIGHKRYETIADIGRTLDELNAEYGTNYSLFLYTTPIKDSIRSFFSDIKSIHYSGYVTGDSFDTVLHSADVLLHVEAFDPVTIDQVRHSISTKIADSLGSGVLLFAYGPSEVASMQHLIRNECAVTVTDKNDLKNMLFRLFFEIDNMPIITKALSTANTFHESKSNSEKLYDILNGSII